MRSHCKPLMISEQEEPLYIFHQISDPFRQYLNVELAQTMPNTHYLNRHKVPNADLLYPASYIKLWDLAERTGGLYELRRHGGIPPRAEKDIVEMEHP